MGIGAIISLITTIISTAASVYAQVQAANAQNEAIEAQYRQKEKETKVEQDQIAEQTALDKFDVTREALRARAKARVSGAESGVLGTNFSRAMLEADMDELFELGKLDTKQDNAVEKTQVELEGMKVSGRVGAASVNPTLAGLQIIGSGVDAYGKAGGFKSDPKPSVKVNSLNIGVDGKV